MKIGIFKTLIRKIIFKKFLENLGNKYFYQKSFLSVLKTFVRQILRQFGEYVQYIYERNFSYRDVSAIVKGTQWPSLLVKESSYAPKLFLRLVSLNPGKSTSISFYRLKGKFTN